jgi:hypothetical protein
MPFAAHRMDAEIADFLLLERRRHDRRRNLGGIATVVSKRLRRTTLIMWSAGSPTAMSMRSPFTSRLRRHEPDNN